MFKRTDSGWAQGLVSLFGGGNRSVVQDCGIPQSCNIYIYIYMVPPPPPPLAHTFAIVLPASGALATPEGSGVSNLFRVSSSKIVTVQCFCVCVPKSLGQYSTSSSPGAENAVLSQCFWVQACKNAVLWVRPVHTNSQITLWPCNTQAKNSTRNPSEY